MNKTLSLAAIVFSCLTPVIGVLFLGWNFSTVIFLYWFENIIVGYIYVLKMLMAEGPIETNVLLKPGVENTVKEKNKAVAAAFVIHYGIFTFGHFLFVYGLFMQQQHLELTVIFSIIALFISHYRGYQNYYIGGKAYSTSSSDKLIKEPYIRIAVLHTTLVLGGFIAGFLTSMSHGYLLIFTLITATIDTVSIIKKDPVWLAKHIELT